MKTLDISAIENVRDAANNFIRSGYLVADKNIIMNSKDLRRNLMQNMNKRRLYNARKDSVLLSGDKKRKVNAKIVEPK